MHKNCWSSIHVLCCESHLIFPWLNPPHYSAVSFTQFSYILMYFFVVLFGYVGTTIYYSNGNCCMPCN